jgi:hypothetical protein
MIEQPRISVSNRIKQICPTRNILSVRFENVEEIELGKCFVESMGLRSVASNVLAPCVRDLVYQYYLKNYSSHIQVLWEVEV